LVPWEEWQHSRAAFNHDWLKNHYLLALEAFLNVLDDLVENQELVQEFVSRLLPEWELRRAQVVDLAERFAISMSPKALFSTQPLLNCAPSERDCLGLVADAIWREHYPVQRWEKDLREAISGVDNAYSALRHSLELGNDTKTVPVLRESRAAFRAFRNACSHLAQAVEVLPGTLEIL